MLADQISQCANLIQSIPALKGGDEYNEKIRVRLFFIRLPLRAGMNTMKK
jgi:hypothetical protein